MALETKWAEEFAQPSYKWIGARHFVDNLQSWRISLFPGGIGFSFFDYSNEKALRVELSVHREDGTTEFYLSDAYHCGEWGGPWQKWQTHSLPLFPYEGLHGRMTRMLFSYGILKDGVVIPSRFRYRFASREDFYRGALALDDFRDPAFMTENDELPAWTDDSLVQAAYDRLNSPEDGPLVSPFFTRGNTGSPFHPIHEIHRAIDTVIERKRKVPHSPASIRLAMYDFDHEHVSRHLTYAKENGIEVECIGEWAQVSSMNASPHIAALRRAGIKVYGMARNEPCRRQEDLSSMHTKFILFNKDVVHSASYNLHFHLWGGNWENSLVYQSGNAALVYEAIYGALRWGERVRLNIDPFARHNIYYSFGTYQTEEQYVRPQDAIVTEIARAVDSILVCMFDLSPIRGVVYGTGRETDVIDALIQARNRGVRVRILLNGQIAHRGPMPEPWDKDFPRPLKACLNPLRDAWMEVYYVYYWESIYSPLHHKFAVFDGRTVITGSYNWYEPSLASDEILTVTRDEAVAGAFLDEAELMLRSFRIRRD